MQNVFIPVILILIVHFIINLGLAYLIKESSIKGYRTISYIVFIGFAVSLPIIQMFRLILFMKNNGAPDALGLSLGFESIVFWIVNFIGMVCIQLIFNQILLTRIVARKQVRNKASR